MTAQRLPGDCRRTGLIRVVNGLAVAHECVLPASHFLPHRCWCGWGFLRSADGRALPARDTPAYAAWAYPPEST
jgi:hypothetical protein